MAELRTIKNFPKEGITFIKNEKGRPEAQIGYHDDLIMALAIGYDIRTQQSMILKQERTKEEQQKTFFNSDRSREYREIGNKIQVI